MPLLLCNSCASCSEHRHATARKSRICREKPWGRQDMGCGHNSRAKHGKRYDMSWQGGGPRHIVGGQVYDMSWAVRWIPIFFIRLRRVLGWRFKIFAAPRGPSMTQAVCCSTVRM